MVKETLDPDTLPFTELAAMRKVEGFAPEFGNWEWGKWQRDSERWSVTQPVGG